MDGVLYVGSNPVMPVLGVGGGVDSVNGKTGDVILIPSDIGAEPEITSENKLSADLVDDTGTTNKFVTASDITNWNNAKTTADSAVKYALVITDYTGD